MGLARRPRAMRATSHSCNAFRSVDEKNVNVDEKNNNDFVLFFDGEDARSRVWLARHPRARCAASHSCYTFRIADGKKVHVDEKNVDFVLFFDG